MVGTTVAIMVTLMATTTIRKMVTLYNMNNLNNLTNGNNGARNLFGGIGNLNSTQNWWWNGSEQTHPAPYILYLIRFFEKTKSIKKKSNMIWW